MRGSSVGWWIGWALALLKPKKRTNGLIRAILFVCRLTNNRALFAPGSVWIGTVVGSVWSVVWDGRAENFKNFSGDFFKISFPPIRGLLRGVSFETRPGLTYTRRRSRAFVHVRARLALCLCHFSLIFKGFLPIGVLFLKL